MARSSYIYVVQDGLTEWEGPVAAFTVKHELVSWLKLHGAVVLSTLRVWRVNDGGPFLRTELSVSELIQ